MASSSRDVPVSESISPLNSSDSDGEDIFEIHRKRMNDVSRLLSPDKVRAFFQPRKRKYIKRDREEAAQRLLRDYFVENPIYPPNIFRRRFRMRRELFLRILNGVTTYDEWFIQKPDALGRMGFTPIQKMTAAIRYQRSPNADDIARLLREGEERGFPGMLGFIDCMHWEWKNYSTAWHGMHTGRSHKPTLILEAVASKNLWIWHAFFGMAGSHNDLNVLDHSPVFKSMINGSMPPVNYVVNGHRHTMRYYLFDGIYPKWATLMQTIPHPTTVKEKLFANKQETVRKDVERAFGVLQMRWAITHQPVLYWNTEDLNKIMRTCIMLHNMIIEDEGEHILQWITSTDDSISLPHYVRNPSMLAAHISSRFSRIRNRSDNADLRRDLMEHLWNQFVIDGDVGEKGTAGALKHVIGDDEDGGGAGFWGFIVGVAEEAAEVSDVADEDDGDGRLTTDDDD
ncbi:uncharacterized protein LOC132277826 [Cornus florida]|uniref:uncharacterized protein LOC132277826 n=1 Tax=Cornus florida TaxID=4283 RepID=UPI00289FA299|nr:uncharacterized protein LOC132277826 [Cornus florida]